MSMRTSIVVLAAAGLVGVSLYGHAAQPSYPEYDEPSRPGLAFDGDNALRSSTARNTGGRTADQDSPLKPSRAASKADRSADGAELRTPSRTPRRSTHTADDDGALNPVGTTRRTVRTADEDTPLKSGFAASHPARASANSAR